MENPNAKIGVLLFLCVIKTWTPCSQIDILDSTCHSSVLRGLRTGPDINMMYSDNTEDPGVCDQLFKLRSLFQA